MIKLYQNIKKILRLVYNFIFTNKTKLLTIRIIYLSAWYRFCILIIPMKKLESYFGIAGLESSHEESDKNLHAAYWIGNRIERVCCKTSWKSLCLVRALIAQHILSQKSIHTTLYLGVRTEDDGMHAHAWLRCGQLFVTGGNGNGHVIVAKFFR